MADWKYFNVKKNGILLEISWYPKDFTARYKFDGITLRYGTHIMAMCPSVFSEERIRDKIFGECIFSSFEEARDIIQTQTVLFESTRAHYSQMKESQAKRKELLTKEISKYRKAFKQGELEQREYQLKIKPLKKQRSDIDFEFSRIYWEEAKMIPVVNGAATIILSNYLQDLWRLA